MLHLFTKGVCDPRWIARWVKLLINIFRKSGWSALLIVLKEKVRAVSDYQEWIRSFESLSAENHIGINSRLQIFEITPRISVVMPVYDPPSQLLDEAIQSVRNQIYPYWELCIADDASTNPDIKKILERHCAQDARIRVVYRKENGHISCASNSALDLATGEFVALLDHDDLLSEQALFWVVDVINRHPDAGLIYSDEDKLDIHGRRFSPYFKCDWNPFLFLCHNMISHLGVYRTSLVRELGGFRPGYEGSQDYDLAARCVERLMPEQIVHVPRILYHWRNIPGSTAMDVDAKEYVSAASEKLLTEHLTRMGWAGRATVAEGGTYYPRFSLPDPLPRISILIPIKSNFDVVNRCVDSIIQKTTYSDFEILLVDNGSAAAASTAFAHLANQPRVKVICVESLPNDSALNNAAASVANGKILVLLDSDTEVIAADWLQEMVSLALLPGVGAVGAKLYYPNNSIRHAGMILGVAGCAGYAFKGFPRDYPGYFGRANLLQAYSVVSGACLMVRKELYWEVGGLNEVDLPDFYSDIDFCLKLREKGLWNVWTPCAELYHYESQALRDEEKQVRLSGEVDYLRKRWANWLDFDPAYSPNLTLDSGDFSYAWPPRVPAGVV